MVEFAAGVTEVTINVELVDDNFIEDDEFFDVLLQNPSFGIVDQNFVRETLVIADNDSKIKQLHLFPCVTIM